MILNQHRNRLSELLYRVTGVCPKGNLRYLVLLHRLHLNGHVIDRLGQLNNGGLAFSLSVLRSRYGHLLDRYTTRHRGFREHRK
jgi:hypothetical protein